MDLLDSDHGRNGAKFWSSFTWYKQGPWMQTWNWCLQLNDVHVESGALHQPTSYSMLFAQRLIYYLNYLCSIPDMAHSKSPIQTVHAEYMTWSYKLQINMHACISLYSSTMVFPIWAVDNEFHTLRSLKCNSFLLIHMHLLPFCQHLSLQVEPTSPRMLF